MTDDYYYLVTSVTTLSCEKSSPSSTNISAQSVQVVNNQYSGSQCTGSIVGKIVYYSGQCFQIGVASQVAFVSFVWPNLLLWDGTNCQGNYQTVDTYTEGCATSLLTSVSLSSSWGNPNSPGAHKTPSSTTSRLSTGAIVGIAFGLSVFFLLIFVFRLWILANVCRRPYSNETGRMVTPLPVAEAELAPIHRLVSLAGASSRKNDYAQVMEVV